MFMKCWTKIKVIHILLKNVLKMNVIKNYAKELCFIPYMVCLKICYCHDNGLIKYRQNVTNNGDPMSVNAK